MAEKEYGGNANAIPGGDHGVVGAADAVAVLLILGVQNVDGVRHRARSPEITDGLSGMASDLKDRDLADWGILGIDIKRLFNIDQLKLANSFILNVIY